MTRKTVTITTLDDPQPRDFHLLDTGDRIARFVAKVRANGGTATVGTLNLSADLRAMLTKCGVNPEAVR